MQRRYGSLIDKALLLHLLRLVWCTIDVNLSEFQYLANHLHDEECRKLVAALHFKGYGVPNPLNEAENRVSKDVPCLEQLLHWNREGGSGGKSESHEFVARRLRQIGRSDLAKWLTRSAYDALGHDLERSIRDTVKLYMPLRLPALNLTTPSPSPTTLLPMLNTVIRVAKQNFVPTQVPEMVTDPTDWTIFDTISWTIVIFLFLLIVVLLIYLTLASPCCKKRRRYFRTRHYDDDDDSGSSFSRRRFRKFNQKRRTTATQSYNYTHTISPAQCMSPTNCMSPPALPPPPSPQPLYTALSPQQMFFTQPTNPPPPPQHVKMKSVSYSMQKPQLADKAVLCREQQTYTTSPKYHLHHSNAFRTIDIHQKIAIPLSGVM